MRLSKTLSYALRHNPAQFGFTLSPDGSVTLSDLLRSPKLRNARPKGQSDDAFLAQVHDMVAAQEKQRLQILERPDGTKAIRANYGHSTHIKTVMPLTQENKEPPKWLLHGTSSASFTSILRQGLLPMGRQAVHATESKEAALEVARRHCSNGKKSWPVLLRIQTGLSGHPWSLAADTWLTPSALPVSIDLSPNFMNGINQRELCSLQKGEARSASDIIKDNEGDIRSANEKSLESWPSPCCGIIVLCPSQKLVCLVGTPSSAHQLKQNPSETVGLWGFPKGKRLGKKLSRQKNGGYPETTIACALRECFEETGLSFDKFSQILPPSTDEPLQEISEKGHVAVQFFLGIVSKPYPVSPQDPAELAAVEWVSWERAPELLTTKNRRDLFESACRLVNRLNT